MEGGTTISPEAIFSLANVNMNNGDEYVSCVKCGFAGCDVRVAGCGCTLHARCCPVKQGDSAKICPHCSRPTSGFVLFPMSFREIDEARRMAAAIASDKRERGRKRRNALISESDSEGKDTKKPVPEDKIVDPSDRRTGRWTKEEIKFCDQIISLFKAGHFPIAEGVKLNDFLANMLKSKQSRLTKKMKNAKLSSITFSRSFGYIYDQVEARAFSELEDNFFNSVHDHLERAEIKFHMQKEWRELFFNICATMGQPVEANAWLSSVEEMDRRSSLAKDAARMTRRKLMMGHALLQDSQNCDPGVFIEKTASEVEYMQSGSPLMGSTHGMDMQSQGYEDMLFLLDDNVGCEYPDTLGGMSPHQLSSELNGKSSMLHSSPFMRRITTYMKRHKVQFEHVDVWVPSFVPNDNVGSSGDSKCRLCFAGSATSDKEMTEDLNSQAKDVPQDAHFNLQAFGDYSEKFSFDVGCGLPGRIYESGIPVWERNVQNSSTFERSGAAQQWGIKTVAAFPVASPNVGRIVVLFYSRYDRPKDHELVTRIGKELSRLMPSPKWKLIVDTSFPPPGANPTSSVKSSENTSDEEESYDSTISEIISLLCQHMPSNPNSTLASYCDAFVSLRLLLLRPTRTQEDEDNVRILTGSYLSYKSSGRAPVDICVMLASDFQFLQKSNNFVKNEPPKATMPNIEQSKDMPQYVFTPHAQPQTDHSNFGKGNYPPLYPVHPSHNPVLDNISIISA